ncbi:hypothetical protein VNO77_24056 [Canavalia gladiata]|uniref:Uncharacterized protein n=1 Tax=Canavalia gladiata TaxID=3824 RepID=A0AAN9L5I6_CANGL
MQVLELDQVAEAEEGEVAAEAVVVVAEAVDTVVDMVRAMDTVGVTVKAGMIKEMLELIYNMVYSNERK